MFGDDNQCWGVQWTTAWTGVVTFQLVMWHSARGPHRVYKGCNCSLLWYLHSRSGPVTTDYNASQAKCFIEFLALKLLYLIFLWLWHCSLHEKRGFLTDKAITSYYILISDWNQNTKKMSPFVNQVPPTSIPVRVPEIVKVAWLCLLFKFITLCGLGSSKSIDTVHLERERRQRGWIKRDWVLFFTQLC